MTIDEARLWSAYVATSYVVFAEDGREVVVRIGERCTALDDLLTAADVETWCFVTAANPDSQALDAETNQTRDEALRRVLAERGCATFDGVGRGDDGAWPHEISHLVLGLSKSEGVALARAFGQRAIVSGVLGGRAELVDCRSTFTSID